MDYTWMVKYSTEFVGTALLIILGNGAVANAELKGTKGHRSGWLLIAWGYGLGVMIPAMMFGNVSGAQINPAFTLGLAVSGLFPWAQVLPYIIAQILGAMVGQLIVVLMHQPFYLKTEDPNAILASFSTVSAVDDGTAKTHGKSWFNGTVNEFFGSFVLFFGALGLTKLFFGSTFAATQLAQLKAQYSGQLSDYTLGLFSNQNTFASLEIAHLAVGFLVFGLVASMGGATGPGLNPARDLGPRLVHWFLPKSVLGEHKGTSKWWYAVVPTVVPIVAALLAVCLFKILYLK